MEGALLALVGIGGEGNQAKLEYILKWFLSAENSNAAMNHTAPVALGLLADARNYAILSALARDTELGREAFGKPVDETMRAFAAYGLGFIGQHSPDPALRRRIVDDLVALLEDGSTDGNDVQVAAMVAIGLVPIEVIENDEVCLCGQCQVADPESSLGSQVTYLLRYFTADREFDPVVRAHTATTLGRLIEAQAESLSAELKEAVAEFLIEALQPYTHQPEEVKQSAVLALGLVGDADDDTVDQWIRWALDRSAGHGGALEKRYALMSLAMVAARKGTGGDPFAGTSQVRTDLLHHLARGKSDVKPWAGLALGVMGFRLADAGGPIDEGVDLALRRVIRRAKTADTLGAYALAAGLRGDREAAGLLIDKLDRVRDEVARSYTALGLGMMGAREAVEPLQMALELADEKPVLALRSGVALGLLSDSSVVDRLLETLEETEGDETRAATARALGFIGDERAIAKLVELMMDEEASDAVRESAVTALGFLSNRSHRSWRAMLAHGANYLAHSPTLTSSEGTGILDMR